MLKEKSTSFTKNPDGSYTRTLKTIFKDDDTYNVIRVDQEIIILKEIQNIFY